MGRSGTFVTNLTGALAYKSFKPSYLPLSPALEINAELRSKLAETYRLLGQLDAMANLIPDTNLYLAMYVRKEALISSQIEGTQATLDDIFDDEIDENTNLDVEEVIHYLKAIKFANERLETLPISIRFIREIHEILLSTSRGSNKQAGELRKSQNWIGGIGSTLKNARFIPPNVEDMEKALTNLEYFIHEDDDLDKIIKIALIHYQFETIHPFLDGNGRIGRLLISLLLKQYGLLNNDLLYLSYYLKLNRQEYYDRLSDVRMKGSYEEWVYFFVDAVFVTAQHAIRTLERINELAIKNRALLENLNKKRKVNALNLLNYLETRPITNVKEAAQKINVTFKTANNLFELFKTLGIVVEKTKAIRYRRFIYEDYLIILRDGT